MRVLLAFTRLSSLFYNNEIMKKIQISSLPQSANSTIQNILYIHLSLFNPTSKILFNDWAIVFR